MSPLPPDLRARILAEARTVPSPTRAQASTGRLGITGVAAVVSVAVFVALVGLRVARPANVVVVTALGAALAAAGATWMAAARGRSMAGRSSAALLATAVIAPLAFVAWSSMATVLDAGPVLAGGTALQHAGCFVFALLFSLTPFAALAYVRRGSDPVHPRALGAALGAAAGTWGGAFIDVHCPLATVEHLAFGHALPIAVLALVGAGVGKWAFGIRAK